MQLCLFIVEANNLLFIAEKGQTYFWYIERDLSNQTQPTDDSTKSTLGKYIEDIIQRIKEFNSFKTDQTKYNTQRNRERGLKSTFARARGASQQAGKRKKYGAKMSR